MTSLKNFQLFTVHCARCTVHGARCTVHGAWCTVHGARCTVHGAVILCWSTWWKKRQTWCIWKSDIRSSMNMQWPTTHLFDHPPAAPHTPLPPHSPCYVMSHRLFCIYVLFSAGIVAVLVKARLAPIALLSQAARHASTCRRSMDGHFYYYAYGSNLLSERIHLRNPSASFIATAKLEVHADTVCRCTAVFANISAFECKWKISNGENCCRLRLCFIPALCISHKWKKDDCGDVLNNLF